MGGEPDGVGGLVQHVNCDPCSRMAHQQLGLIGSFADFRERNADEHHR